jgi:hypothetical protein
MYPIYSTQAKRNFTKDHHQTQDENNLNQRRWLAGASLNHNTTVLRLAVYPDSPPRFPSDRVQYAAGTSAVRLPKHHFSAGRARRATMMNNVVGSEDDGAEW